MSRDGIAFFGGNRNGIVHRIDHPFLRYHDHKTKPNRATVFGGIMLVIVSSFMNILSYTISNLSRELIILIIYDSFI